MRYEMKIEFKNKEKNSSIFTLKLQVPLCTLHTIENWLKKGLNSTQSVEINLRVDS